MKNTVDLKHSTNFKSNVVRLKIGEDHERRPTLSGVLGLLHVGREGAQEFRKEGLTVLLRWKREVREG